MTHDDRPLSPDLQIYRPQLTSVLSITHRLTGVALSIGSPLLVYWLIAAAAGPSAYAALHGFLASWLGLLLLLGWTFSLFFHLCNRSIREEGATPKFLGTGNRFSKVTLGS
jgi:succinate dehydrogenase / fumarate reductase, cytochrome b subunit